MPGRTRRAACSTTSSRSTGSAAGATPSGRARSRRSSTRCCRPDDLVEGAAVRRHEVSSLGMGQVDLELGPHPRQRTAELVGGVGDQASLLVRGPLEAIEHPVHGVRQPRDLVAGLGHGDPMIEVVRADGGDLAPDRLHRPDRPPHEPPDDRPEQDRDEGDGRDEGPLQCGGALSHVVEVDAEVEDRAVGQGLGAHPVGPLALHHAADVPHDVIIAAHPAGRRWGPPGCRRPAAGVTATTSPSRTSWATESSSPGGSGAAADGPGPS